MRIMELSFLVLSTLRISDSWSTHIESHISRHPKIYQVVFLTDNAEALNVPGISDLLRKISSIRLTLQTDVSSFDDSKYLVEDNMSTLFIYIHTTNLSPLPSDSTIHLLKDSSFAKLQVEYLIITYSEVSDALLKEFFATAWTRQLLNFAVLEITEDPQGMSQTVLLHQYNPFEDHLTTEAYSEQSDLFPDLLVDMHGYPLTVSPLSEPPFNSIVKDDEVVKWGSNLLLVDTIASRMNFTMELMIPQRRTSFYDTFMENELDIYANLFPHFWDHGEMNNFLTTTVGDDSLCAVVSRQTNTQSTFSVSVLNGYVPAPVIAALFWVLVRVLRMDRDYWGPLMVVMLLLGMGVSRQPTAAVERIMFASLILISIVYGTELYGSLTHGLMNQADVSNWDDLEELVESGMTPVMQPLYYNKTFNHAEGMILKMKDKVRLERVSTQMGVMRLKFDEYGKEFFMTSKRYLDYAGSNPNRPLTMMQPCLWTDTTALLLSRESPYRNRIGEIITRCREMGFIQKWYTKIWDRWHLTNIQEEEDSEIRSINRTGLLFLMIGYIVAVIVFFWERNFYHLFG